MPTNTRHEESFLGLAQELREAPPHACLLVAMQVCAMRSAKRALEHSKRTDIYLLYTRDWSSVPRAGYLMLLPEEFRARMKQQAPAISRWHRMIRSPLDLRTPNR